MQTMCSGSYPLIEEQARALQAEPGMPEWSLPIYVKKIETINLMIMCIMIEAFRRKLEKLYGKGEI